MTKYARTAILGGIILITWMAPVLSAPAEEEYPHPDMTQVREAHRALAEAKQQAMADRAFRQKLLPTGSTDLQTDYDVLFYDIHILTDDIPEISPDTMYGRVKFLAQATTDGVAEIQFDYNGAKPLDSIIAPTGSLAFSRSGDQVTVTLDRSYNTDEQFEFDVFYRSTYTFIPRTQSGTVCLATYSEPWSARNWWPCKDRPDDKADSFKIAVTVDTSFYVGSNGTLDSIVYEGDRRHTFYYTEHYPMVTYLFSLAISEYTVWYDEWVHNGGLDTMLITNAVFPDVYTKSLQSYGVVPGALSIFSDIFGPYPFADEKYGHSTDGGGGAMEHQTMSTMGTTDRIFSEWVVVHELAHQWWGDMITCRSWGHLWLNEGFATYCEALYFEQKIGHEFYLDYMTGIEYHNASRSVYSYDTLSNLFTLAQYHKGGWVLHMLRGVVGDSLFFAGMRAYYNSEFQHGTATTEDFRDIMESVSGVDLDWFFDEWVYGWYLPNYQWTYYHEPAGGGTDVYMIVEQTQTTTPQVFTMPVEFYFQKSTSSYTRDTLWVDQRSQRFKFHVDLDDIMLVQLDRDNWVLEVNSQFTWGVRIVTFPEEISDAQQYLAYVDTIEAKGGNGQEDFTIVAGALPDGYEIDNDGLIGGITSDTGQFTFTVHIDAYGQTDDLEFTLTVSPTSVVAGDVDYNGSVDVGDLTFLVAYLFQGGPPPPIADLADVDASCAVDVGDLTYLVAYLFQSGPAPLMGCVL